MNHFPTHSKLARKDCQEEAFARKKIQYKVAKEYMKKIINSIPLC